MRIAVVVDRYYPYIGGIEQYVRGLCRQMVTDGHDVTIITAYAPDTAAEELSPEGRILRTPVLEGAASNPGLALHRASDIARLLRRVAPDVVYANNHASLGAIRGAQKWGIPAVYGCHSWGLMCPSKIRLMKPTGELCHAETSYGACMSCYAAGSASALVKLPGFVKQAARVRKYLNFHDILSSADARIGISHLVAGMFREQSNTYAIYPGLDLQAYRPVDAGEFRQALGIEGEYVLVPGRINPIKGQMDALRALKHLSQDVKMVFAGNVTLNPQKPAETGPYGRRLAEEAQKMGLRERVVFTGMLTQPQMAAAYSGAAVTLVPSVWSEPFGYVAAESMACGTPVVITRNCGAAELVDESVGQKVPRQDPEAMALAIKRVMKRREAMGHAARRIAEERLTWPKVAEQVVSVLAEATQRRKSAGARVA